MGREVVSRATIPGPRPAGPDAVDDGSLAPLAPSWAPEDVHVVAIASLLAADSPRLAGEDREHVLRLAETEAQLPPILVHRPTMRIIDGMHRFRAAILKGETHIRVTFFDGNQIEAFVRAVEANIAHGLPLGQADRRAAAMRIMTAQPHLSDRSIAAHTGLSARAVATLRRSTGAVPQSNDRVGADGRTRPVHGAAGRRRAAEVIAARPDAPLREIAKVAGVAVSTAHDVRRRLVKGQDPVPDRYAADSGSEAATARRAAAPSASRPDRDGQGADHSGADRTAILQRLMKDPSLRQTEAGRSLLRLLHAQVFAPKDWHELIDGVPLHCREIVAELARQCARTWSQFATELDPH
jgi:hypothetical protein